MKAAYIKTNGYYLPAIIKKQEVSPFKSFCCETAQAALEAAQKEIDRLKDAKLKKKKKAKKKHPPIFVDKNTGKSTYIVCVEIEAVLYSLDSSGDWVKLSECLNCLHFPTYQEAYQAGLDYLKSL